MEQGLLAGSSWLTVCEWVPAHVHLKSLFVCVFARRVQLMVCWYYRAGDISLAHRAEIQKHCCASGECCDGELFECLCCDICKWLCGEVCCVG